MVIPKRNWIIWQINELIDFMIPTSVSIIGVWLTLGKWVHNQYYFTIYERNHRLV